MNQRISPKERGLIKGALRRVFSRSDLRRIALSSSIIEHTDPNRIRVKKWSRCTICKEPTPTYLMQIDHVDPIVPINTSLEQMSWDEVINRIWCEVDKLDPLCKSCHSVKTKLENKARRALKKGTNT